MPRVFRLLAGALAAVTVTAAAAPPPPSAPDWHFVGNRLSKPDRIFYFIDMASTQRSGQAVTFDWTAYGEKQTTPGVDFGRWSEYTARIDCAANTSQTLSGRERRPDGSLFTERLWPQPKGWNDVYPISPAAPSALFSDILCQRKQIRTLPIKSYTIPQAVASIIQQLG